MTTFDVPTEIIRVNLSTETSNSEEIPASWLRQYLGGKGLGARYLFEEVRPGVDPLGEENVLCLFRGLFSGFLPGDTRYTAITKSPLTGIFVDSYSGGDFAQSFIDALGAHMGVIIEGRASEPIELHLTDGKVSIRSAADRWGLDTASLSDSVEEGTVAGIGPAGERQVRYATIATDGGDHHAGRGGTGAVMGSKRLKAIIATGEPLQDDTLAAVKTTYEERFTADPRGRWHRSSGTLETVDAADTVGVLPTRGWSEGSFEGAEQLGIDSIRSVATHRERGDEGVPGDFDVEGTTPRGGLGIALGANIGIDDMDAVLELGETCDTLGLDIIESGNALAWAMLASEAGHIEREIKFGDVTTARELLTEIANRSTRLGSQLADGIDAAAAILGGEDLVPTVKSMAVASYDPRPAPSMALAFATSDRGACHRRSRPVFEEILDASAWDDATRIEVVTAEQELRSLLWCYIVDDVTVPAFEADLGKAYFDAIGLEMEESELREIGERVWTLTRLFNVREGTTAADDRIPPTFTRPLEAGPHEGAVIDEGSFNQLLQQYYAAREWGSDGRPTRDLIERLDMTELVDGEVPLADTPASFRN